MRTWSLGGAQAAGNEAVLSRIVDGALFQSPTLILINPRMQTVPGSRWSFWRAAILYMSHWSILSHGRGKMAKSP